MALVVTAAELTAIGLAAVGTVAAASSLGISLGSLINGIVSKAGVVIVIQNKLETPVMIKAFSGDDDLGFKEVLPGNIYTFSFKSNIWGTTQFQAQVIIPATDNTEKKSTNFDVFGDSADRAEGTKNYSLRPDAIYYQDNVFKNWS